MLDLCIIGFGISGIASARWAHKENLNFVVLEKIIIWVVVGIVKVIQM